MKKWIAFLLIFVLAFTLYGCDDDNGEGNGDETVAIRAIVIEDAPTNMQVGDTAQLKAKVEPAEAKQTVIWTSRDEAKATVSETGLVTALAAGTVEIVATSTENRRMQKIATINIEAPIVWDDPTGIELKADRSEFRVNAYINLTATVYPEASALSAGAIQDVVWESSDDEVAAVDSKGRVTGLKEGTAVITVTSVADPSFKDTLEVTVVKSTGGGEVITDPEDIVVRGEKEVEEGYSIALVSSVLPSGVSQRVTWESLTPDLASVSASGIVTGIKAGKAVIRVYSNVDFEVERFYDITVKPEVPLPAPNNLNNYEIILFTAPHVPHEHDPHLEGYVGLDKQAKIEAWAEVENKFNTTLTVSVFPDTAPWGPQRINYVINNANTNEQAMDIFVSTTDWLIQFANANATVDVLDFYNTYGKNSMNPVLKDASTYKGAMYSLLQNDYGSIRPYHALIYNVALMEERGLVSPAQLFNEGEWTWSRFVQYVEEASGVLEEEESVFSGKPSGLFYGMASAAGLKLVDTVAMTINFTNPLAVQAGYLLRDLYVYSDNIWGSNAWDEVNPTFTTGKSLFNVGEYWFIKTGNRFPDDMWGEDTRYGYVPFPYPDGMDKEDTRVSNQGGANYQIPMGRVYPEGVTAEDVYRVWTEMMLGTVAKMQADPQYNEDSLIIKAAEFKLDDPASIEAIAFFKADKVIYDPYYSIVDSATNAGPMVNAFVVDGEDYMAVADRYYTVFMTALQAQFG